ncbi:C80 family cysteine peptidase, partial [Bathymodiolus azoricus thioautotrophic gill symbiont]|uniref:C80 family cysteine peptidase n=1 Tax=Bathymodiolus azoricus thioautotrophic gill symbiont TaxID=235205 RepID=UPI00192AD50E
MKTMGADVLSSRITALQAKLNIEQTDEGRIALVGCETDRASVSGDTSFNPVSFTKLVAEKLYDNGKGSTNAEVTGRTADIEVDANGRKVMRTGGQKTLYSWDSDKGEITQRTETVKSHSEQLENPLGGFDEYSKLLNELIKKKSSTSSKHYTFLRRLKEDFQRAKELEPGVIKTKIFEKMFEDLDRHLPGRETKYQKQFDKLSVMTRKYAENALAYHLENRFNKGELDIDVSVDMLKDIAGLSLGDQLTRIERAKSEFERLLSQDEINLEKNAARKAWAKVCVRKASEIVSDITESQRALSVWDKTTVTNQFEVSPDPRDTHYVVVQLQDNPAIEKGSANIAGKHFKNSTLIQMDKDGGYRIVHGPKLHKIKADNIKILFDGHGSDSLKTIGRRTANDIVEHVVALRGVLPAQSSIDTVSIKGCNPGNDFGKDVAIGLKERRIETKVSSRLGSLRIELNGRTTVDYRYHLDEGKVVWGYKDGLLTQFDPYTDDNYHLVVSVGEGGLVQLQLNKRIEGLEGKLRIRVIASDSKTTLAALKEIERRLPDGASMAEINIKMGNGNADWYATHGVSDYAGLVSYLSSRFNANVLTYSPSGPNRGSYAYRYEKDKETTVNGLAGANGVTNGFVFYDTRPSDDVGFFYRKNKTAVLYSLAKRPSHNKIPVVLIDSDSYSEQELLGQLKGAINQIEGSVSQIKIITKNTTMSDDDYKSMMKFLSKELHVSVQAYNTYTQTKPWLSINPGDSQVTKYLGARHLSETTPYQDKKLQSWDTLTQEQTNKLTTESQKTKPDLANHDHQILFQTEADDNIKDSTLKLAFKHPTKTTIVQMDKDGAYRVVYGTQL